MRRIPSQHDVRSIVRHTFGETEPSAHLQARLVVDHHFDPRATSAGSPFLHERAGDRGTEALRLMLRGEQEVDEIYHIRLVLLDQAPDILPFDSDYRIDRVR